MTLASEMAPLIRRSKKSRLIGKLPAYREVKTSTKDADLIRDRREQLIRAAIKVFGEKGFHQTTVRDIGRAARLTQGTIYNYVRRKEDILLMVCERIVTEYQRLAPIAARSCCAFCRSLRAAAGLNDDRAHDEPAGRPPNLIIRFFDDLCAVAVRVFCCLESADHEIAIEQPLRLVLGGVEMYRGTKDIMLPTTITGSLPRPSWYTENLGTRMFLDAMVSRRYREQYVDTLCCYLREQELAGLDIVTDGDCRFDDDVGGQSWTSYPPHHMSGYERGDPRPTPAGRGGLWFPRGHILHDYLESRVMPVIIGPVGRGDLQYTTLWKTAQRLTTRPVKFGAVSAEIVAFASQDRYYKSVPDRMLAIADAFNEEYNELADAGCPVIQIEEPQIHLAAARGIQDKVITPELMVEVFNRTVKGLRAKTEVWAHSCWGNPSQQRMFAKGAELQAVARDLQQGRRRRDHV